MLRVLILVCVFVCNLSQLTAPMRLADNPVKAFSSIDELSGPEAPQVEAEANMVEVYTPSRKRRKTTLACKSEAELVDDEAS